MPEGNPAILEKGAQMSFTQKSDTAARFTHLAGQQLTDEQGNPLVNDTLDADTGAILRFKNGFLDGGHLPAIECDDAHMEFYKDGQLHREEAPRWYPTTARSRNTGKMATAPQIRSTSEDSHHDNQS